MEVSQNHLDPNHGASVEYRKIFIQRDYSEGTNVKFHTKFPPELEGLIDSHCFEHTISTLNKIYGEAENITGKSFSEGCFACITAYLIYLCVETNYQKCLKKIASFLDEQNETVWLPRGLHITDPIEHGLRVIKITVLSEPAHPS